MYSTHLRVGKTFVAEQKIRELKKNLLQRKRTQVIWPYLGQFSVY